MSRSPAEILRAVLLAFAMLASTNKCVLAANVFQGLGSALGTATSSATDISGDGRVVVGNAGGGIFRWTASGGTQLFDFVYPTSPHTNYDGSSVVGANRRWTPATGVQQIPNLQYIDWGSNANAVSDNGSIIVGSVDLDGFRWDGPSGPPKSTGGAVPTDISGDGKVIVAYLNNAQMWRQETGWVPLGQLPNESFGLATAVADRANVVVGVSYGGTTTVARAWRWTPTSGMVDLIGFGGSPRQSEAWDVSADGAIVVGNSGQLNQTQASIWAQHLGMLPLQEWLIANHVTGLTGWQLTTATGVSADGRSIVGQGTNPNGQAEAWLVRLPTLGDANADGLVDGADYTSWADHYLGQTNLFANGDFNWDGVVNGADYVIWADHYTAGRANLSALTVPEPSSFFLASVAVATLLIRRRQVVR